MGLDSQPFLLFGLIFLYSDPRLPKRAYPSALAAWVGVEQAMGRPWEKQAASVVRANMKGV